MKPSPLTKTSSSMKVSEIVAAALAEALQGIEFIVDRTPGVEPSGRFWSAIPVIADHDAFVKHIVDRTLATPGIVKELKTAAEIESQLVALQRKIDQCDSKTDDLWQRQQVFKEQKAQENAKIKKDREELANAVKDFKADMQAKKAELEQEQKNWKLERESLEAALTQNAEVNVYKDYHKMAENLRALDERAAGIQQRLDDQFNENARLRDDNASLLKLIETTLAGQKEIALKGVKQPETTPIYVTQSCNDQSDTDCNC